MARILRPDPFSPILLKSRSLSVSDEQTSLIKQILDVSCSDSRFAQKAYVAIGLVLTVGSTTPPLVNSLDPSTIEIGQPSTTLHVQGTGFKPSSIIVFNGIEEPTTFISSTELTTGINMDVWLDPQTAIVTVRNGSVESDPVNFTFTEAAPPELGRFSPSDSNDIDGLRGDKTPFGDTNDPGYQKPIEPVSDRPVVSPDPVINIPPSSTISLEELESRKPAIKTIEEPATEQIAEKQAQEGLTPTVNKEGKPFDQAELDRLIKPANLIQVPEENSKETNTFNPVPDPSIPSISEKK